MMKSTLIKTFNAVDEKGNQYQIGEYQEMIQVSRTLSGDPEPDLPGLLHYIVMGSGQRVSINSKDDIQAIGIGKLTKL
jgi:hypothetical protein